MNNQIKIKSGVPVWEILVLFTLLICTMFLGGHTLYEINTTDIHGIVSSMVK